MNGSGPFVLDDRNVISGNASYGIDIHDSGTKFNVVAGNDIGTNADGTLAIGNLYGVVIDNNASGNTIGGLATTPGAGVGNVISGNNGHGIQISFGAADNMVAGNLIGLSAAATTRLGNTYQGIEIFAAGPGNSVGGAVAGLGNTVAANNGFGIELAGTSGTLLEGNTVGTNGSNATGLGNGAFGIRLIGSSQNTIGGTVAAARNVISGNATLACSWSTPTTTFGVTGPSNQNVVEGNYIGACLDGSTALANSSYGVRIEGIESGNTIGGSAAGAGNVISGNCIRRRRDHRLECDRQCRRRQLIGTDATGTYAIPNYAGVEIDGGATGNLIGTNGDGVADASERNIISGNLFAGVWITEREYF